MSEPLWGETGASDGAPARPAAPRDGGTEPPADLRDVVWPLPREDGEPERDDPVTVVALVLGGVGLVVFGLLTAVVTAIVAAYAGQRAVRARRSPRPAYLAFGLAVLDAIVWLVLQKLFELPAYVG